MNQRLQAWFVSQAREYIEEVELNYDGFTAEVREAAEVEYREGTNDAWVTVQVLITAPFDDEKVDDDGVPID